MMDGLEELVDLEVIWLSLSRQTGHEAVVLKPGMMFGRGDHMLDHIRDALRTFPFFVGIGPRRVRPFRLHDLRWFAERQRR